MGRSPLYAAFEALLVAASARAECLFLERIEARRSAPLGPDWDGTFTHWEK